MDVTRTCESIWHSPEELRGLDDHSLHVWSVTLNGCDERGDALLEEISAEERQEAGRRRIEHVRRQFVARRAAVRRVLARYLHADPSAIGFQFGAYGKPSLAAPWSASRIRFSVTHSGELVLVAIALDHDLGIDVEQLREVEDYPSLCRRYFAPQEQDALLGLPESEQRSAFFRVWTRKEALMKALGTGISIGLDQVVVSVDAQPSHGLLAIHGSAAATARWRLEDLDPAPGYLAVLARPTGVWNIARYRWP